MPARPASSSRSTRIGDGDRLSLVGQGPGRGHRHLAALRRRGRRQAGRWSMRRWPDDRGVGHAEFFRVLGGWLREHLGDDRRCSASATAWCMAAPTIAAPVRVDPRCSPGSRRSARWHRCISRTISPASARSPRPSPTCRRSPASTPPSTAAIPSSPTGSPCRAGSTTKASAATASTACPTSTSRACCPRSRRRSPGGRVVVAHLGSGASMCAHRRTAAAIDSTMGFTALDGLPMGTRCGALDPGVVLYLIRAPRHGRRCDRAHALPRLRPEGRVRDQQRHARRCWRATIRAPRTRSSCSSGGSAASSARSPPRSAASMASCSPPGSASARPRSARGSARAPPGSASSSTRRPTAPAGRASRPPASRVAVYAIPTDEEQMIARHTLAVLRRAPTAGAA